MLIKYFYQIGHQFQYDINNPMIIPDVEKYYFTRTEILDLLEKDKVEVDKLESLKYWNKTHEGWVDFSEKTKLHILSDSELRLLIKISEDNHNLNSDLQIKLKNMTNNLSYQETRIKELENRLKSLPALTSNVHNLNLHHQPSSGSIHDIIDICRNGSSMNFVNVEESRLDFAFLYSNPLVKEDKDKPQALNEPIDFEREINLLIDIFQDSQKKVTARFEVANIDNISEIIRKKPRILHISCHGAYEHLNGESRFFLYFEDNKGKLDKFDLKKIEDLLKSSVDEKSQIEVVFVSACHSEAIADVFRQAKVPAVICVDSATKVLDEAAQKFAKIFYNALLDGKSIFYSFDQAKKVVSAGIDQNSKIPHCCCIHTHKPDCRWHEKYIDDPEAAHNLHLKQCNCKYSESHIHLRNCNWAIKLLSDETFSSSQFNSHLIKICCCSPDTAHDESKKFIIKGESEPLKETPYAMIPQGTYEIKNKNCFLNINFSVEMKTSLIGRNVELYNVLSVFSSGNVNKNRMVTIYGNEGVGKNSFVKLAGKYMFERKFFQDGVIYINSRGHVISDMWFFSKVVSSLDLEHPVDDIHHFCNLIRQLRILLIVNLSRQCEDNLKGIKLIIKTILDDTRNPKILISTEKPLELESFENKLLLEPLSEYYSAKLLMTLAGEHLPKIIKNDIEAVAKHDIIKISGGIPSKIHQIAGLLQEHKKLEVLIEKIKKENMKKQFLSDELVKVLLDNMSKNSNLIYEILYVLCILPQGILECEIINLYKSKCHEVKEALDYIANNTIIVSKSFNRELKSVIYTLSEDLTQSVESLNIDENIKLKCYREVVIYYGNLVRNIVNSIFIENDSAIEFSAAQNKNMWMTLNKSSFKYKFEKVHLPSKHYLFVETNILNVIKVDNRFMALLLSQNKNDFEFIESIEQLSICMPTILKIDKKITECLTCYNYFLKICEEHKLTLAQGRLLLFKASLYSLYFQHTSGNFFQRNNLDNSVLQNLISAKKIFSENKFEEGEAETGFVKASIMFEMEINKNKYSHEKISKEVFENIVSELNRSIKIYRNIDNSHGLARASFILAEYSIFYKNFDESVLSHYREAMSIFEKEGKKILAIKCLQGLSKWYLGIKNYDQAKEVMEQAKTASEKMKNGSNNGSIELLHYEINKGINEILDQSRVKSHNVFVFIKAHQLVKMHINSDLAFHRSKSIERCLSATHKDVEYTVDPPICHYSTFRDRLKDRFSKTKKELIIKFDILTENNLRESLSKVGRVLHISSDDYNENGSLFVEGQDGVSIELSPNELSEILATSRCSYDLVILAIPQSENLAKSFVDNGVPHVICFKFLDDFLKSSECLPLISFHNIIHEFTIAMLNSIILEQTVEDAYNYALREFNSQIVNVKQILYDYNLQRDYIKAVSVETTVNTNQSQNVLLLPEGKNHKVKLYGKSPSHINDETVLLEGKLLDLSKCRARLYNVSKRNHALIGRKREVYQLVKMVRAYDFLNLYGDSGCGKTLLAKEVCYFLYMRNYFKEGIFYFDISEVRNVEKIKALFHEAQVYAALESMKKVGKENLTRSMLIIFDNCDRMIKYNDSAFFIFLKSLNSSNESFVSFILLSYKPILNECVTESYKVPRLSLQESLYFFLYYVKRNLNKNEIDYDTSEADKLDQAENMSDLASISLRINLCRGLPKYLKKLADLTQKKPIKTIDMRELNLPKSRDSESTRSMTMTMNSFTHKEANHLRRENHSNTVNPLSQSVNTYNMFSLENDSENQLVRCSMQNERREINIEENFNNYFNTNPDSARSKNSRTSRNSKNSKTSRITNMTNMTNMTNLNNSLNTITGQGLSLNQSVLLNNRPNDTFNSVGNKIPSESLALLTSLTREKDIITPGKKHSLKLHFKEPHIGSNYAYSGYYQSYSQNSLNSSMTDDRELVKNIEGRKSLRPDDLRMKMKKKQSEIIEVVEDEKDIFSENEKVKNDDQSQISYILRPSHNDNDDADEDSYEDGDEDGVDTFIYNQAFSSTFKKESTKRVESFTESESYSRGNDNLNTSNISNNINQKNKTFYFDLFNPTDNANLNVNGNTNINIINGQHVVQSPLRNNLNITVLPSDSVNQSMTSHPIIIQNFFSGRDEKSRDNLNMNINIATSLQNASDSSSTINNLNSKNPFKTPNKINEIFKLSKKKIKTPIDSLVNNSVRDSMKESVLPDTSHPFSQKVDETANLSEVSLRRTMSNVTNTSLGQSNKKKKKKGMKSGKMHDKYKQKSNNKYQPNQRKKVKENSNS